MSLYVKKKKKKEAKLLVASPPPTSFLILVSREYDIGARFDVQKSPERSTKKLGGGGGREEGR